MRWHREFEWDEAKAQLNLRKHRVSFDDAGRVLGDEEADTYHVEEFDEEHSDEEDRYVTTASHPDDRQIVLRIAWTERAETQAKNPITRILSARLATTRERKTYAKEIGRK
jgi:uncharacterized DUF497 family protein